MLWSAAIRHAMFQRSVPLLYDDFVETPLPAWPSLTVDWLPPQSGSEGTRQLLIGTQTGGQEPNMLKVVEVQVGPAERQPERGEPPAAAGSRGQGVHDCQTQQGVQACRSGGPSAENAGDFMETAGPQVDRQMERAEETQHCASPPPRTRRRYRTFCFPHPSGGDGIDRARHMPQHPHLVATKISDQGLYLFDISPALGGGAVQGHEQGLVAGHGTPGPQDFLRQGQGHEAGSQSQQLHHHHNNHNNHHNFHHLQQQHRELDPGLHRVNGLGNRGRGGVQGIGKVCNGLANGTGYSGGGGVQGNGEAWPAGAGLLPEGSSDTVCMCGGPLGSLGPQHGRGSSKRKSGSSSANPAPSGFGLCWSPTDPGWLLSTCANGAIQHVRVDATTVASAAATASRPGGLPVLGTCCFQRNAHGGGVNDVAFPAAEAGASSSVWSGSVYASVGEDGLLKLWDDRQPGTAVCVPAHKGYAANCVAFSTGHIIATGGSDGKLKLFDLRAVASRLTQDAAIAATMSEEGGNRGPISSAPRGQVNCDEDGPANIHADTNNGGNTNATGGNTNASTSNNHSSGSSSGRGQDVLPFLIFGSHKCSVNQVSWSSDWPSLLVSTDDDNRIFVWDVARTQPTPMDITSPPQLRFIHSGHASSVYDISWANSNPGPSVACCRPAATPLLASVSPVFYDANEGEENDEEGEDKEREPLQWHVLHTFSPAAEILQLNSQEHPHSTTHDR